MMLAETTPQTSVTAAGDKAKARKCRLVKAGGECVDLVAVGP